MPKESTPLTRKQLKAMSSNDREMMALFATILRNWTGSTSPAEEFICGLVRYHASGRVPLTPDNLEDDIREFRAHFEMMIPSARLIARQYPAEVLGENCGAWRDQVEKLKAMATENEPGDWRGQAHCYLEIARRAIREFPALVLSDESMDDIKRIMGFGK